MGNMLTFCSNVEEIRVIEKISRENAALVGNEKWLMEYFNQLIQVKEKLKNEPLLDIFCYDIVPKGSLGYVKEFRKKYNKALLMLIADLNIEPTEYIRPSVMPSALLMRPVNEKSTKHVIREIFEAYVESIDNNVDNEVFVADTLDGKVKIPISQIIYFEARNKRIYARISNKEIGFYSTIEKLEKRFAGDFTRCHRGYLVNNTKIESIDYADNLVHMYKDVVIPMSRTYKQAMKNIEIVWINN